MITVGNFCALCMVVYCLMSIVWFVCLFVCLLFVVLVVVVVAVVVVADAFIVDSVGC